MLGFIGSGFIDWEFSDSQEFFDFGKFDNLSIEEKLCEFKFVVF